MLKLVPDKKKLLIWSVIVSIDFIKAKLDTIRF